MFSSVKQFLPEKKENSNRLFDLPWKNEMLPLKFYLLGVEPYVMFVVIIA